MARRKTSNPLKEYEEQYRQKRFQYWKQFDEHLEILQRAYDITVTELAEGLNVSRQKFYDFRESPEKGLSIDQASLVILWEWLTDPKVLNSKRISAQTKEKRKGLRQQGPNSLLKAAGYQSSSLGDEHSAVLKLDSSLKRVLYRLSSPWIKNGVRRSKIIDFIFDAVRNQGRLDRTSQTEAIGVSAALSWIKDEPLKATDQTLISEYQKKILTLAQSGKSTFVEDELFELYQNILEYQSIDNYAGTRVDIVDCQFPIISRPIPHSIQAYFEPFRTIYQQAENELSQLVFDINSLNIYPLDDEQNINSRFTPVVRALITSQFDGSEKPTTWRYSSTGTHYENILHAIKRGLGHSLETTGFSIQAMGNTSKSLARVSIGLAERDAEGNTINVYQGWWVDSNAIKAILIATVIATKDWLSSHGADLSKYFSICRWLGEIDDHLYLIRENVQEYFFRINDNYFNNNKIQNQNEYFDSLESKLLDIDNSLLNEDKISQIYYRNLRIAVQNRLTKIRLTRMRLDLKLSETERSSYRLSEVKSFITEYEDKNEEMNSHKNISEETAYRHVLFLQASECVMLQNFYSGNKQFLNGKLWRYRSRYNLENGLKKLENFLKFIGYIDFEAFSSASQLYGVIGLLELYMAEDKEEEYLKKAVNYLLYAAHYARRIGYVRRSIYWLTHASRVYCRLGNLEQSEQLSKVVESSANAVHREDEEESDYDSKFKAFITATIDLAKGERLLAKGKTKEAIMPFVEALKQFIGLHSTDRLTADALYGLYQASCGSSDTINTVFSGLAITEKQSDSEQGMDAVFKKITSSLQGINPETSWKSNSSIFKNLAQSIWHYWATGSEQALTQHPIEELMERDCFLAVIISS